MSQSQIDSASQFTVSQSINSASETSVSEYTTTENESGSDSGESESCGETDNSQNVLFVTSKPTLKRIEKPVIGAWKTAENPSQVLSPNNLNKLK